MIWDESSPTLSTAANTIHTCLQNAKKMCMERMKSTNTEVSPFDEHDVYGASATGIHVKSKVGWVKVFTTYAQMTAYTPKLKGALYYVTGTSALYLVLDSSGTLAMLSTLDHSQTTGRSDDDHTQYYLGDGTRPFSSWIHVESYDDVMADDGPNDDDSMDAGHLYQSWNSAHADDGGCGIEHFADECLGNEALHLYYVFAFWTFQILGDVLSAKSYYGGDPTNANFVPMMTVSHTTTFDYIQLSNSDSGPHVHFVSFEGAPGFDPSDDIVAYRIDNDTEAP